MPKAIAPTFCEGMTVIAGPLYCGCNEGLVTYFHGSTPMFTHTCQDEASFRMILSQFFINGLASQARLVAVFSINPLALKRWVKQYRSAGSRSFFETRPRLRRAPSIKKKP